MPPQKNSKVPPWSSSNIPSNAILNTLKFHPVPFILIGPAPIHHVHWNIWIFCFGVICFRHRIWREWWRKPWKPWKWVALVLVWHPQDCNRFFITFDFKILLPWLWPTVLRSMILSSVHWACLCLQRFVEYICIDWTAYPMRASNCLPHNMVEIFKRGRSNSAFAWLH